MTIDQQLRDRFDRAMHGSIPEPDLAAAIQRGRRNRRRRAASYAAGALAVAAVAVTAVAIPRLSAAERLPTAAVPAANDGTFVPGTTIDTDLAAAVAAAEPSLPEPTDVYPSDWNHDGPIADADFADATEWQLVYQLSPDDELLVYVSKTLPGNAAPMECGGSRPPGEECSIQPVAAGSLGHFRQVVGDAGDRRFWFVSALQSDDKTSYISVFERLQADGDGWQSAERRRVLTDAQLDVISQAGGLSFPDPQEWPRSS